MICSKCEKELPEKSIFCLSCGQKVAPESFEDAGKIEMHPKEVGNSTKIIKQKPLDKKKKYLALALIAIVILAARPTVLKYKDDIFQYRKNVPKVYYYPEPEMTSEERSENRLQLLISDYKNMRAECNEQRQDMIQTGMSVVSLSRKIKYMRSLRDWHAICKTLSKYPSSIDPLLKDIPEIMGKLEYAYEQMAWETQSSKSLK